MYDFDDCYASFVYVIAVKARTTSSLSTENVSEDEKETLEGCVALL